MVGIGFFTGMEMANCIFIIKRPSQGITHKATRRLWRWSPVLAAVLILMFERGKYGARVSV